MSFKDGGDWERRIWRPPPKMLIFSCTGKLKLGLAKLIRRNVGTDYSNILYESNIIMHIRPY